MIKSLHSSLSVYKFEDEEYEIKHNLECLSIVDVQYDLFEGFINFLFLAQENQHLLIQASSWILIELTNVCMLVP